MYFICGYYQFNPDSWIKFADDGIKLLFNCTSFCFYSSVASNICSLIIIILWILRCPWQGRGHESRLCTTRTRKEANFVAKWMKNYLNSNKQYLNLIDSEYGPKEIQSMHYSGPHNSPPPLSLVFHIYSTCSTFSCCATAAAGLWSAYKRRSAKRKFMLLAFAYICIMWSPHSTSLHSRHRPRPPLLGAVYYMCTDRRFREVIVMSPLT